MKSLADVQKDLEDSYDLITEIVVQTITLTRLGGYNAKPYSKELDLVNDLSAKSLKGVLRWWSRVAVVGAYGGTIDYVQANGLLAQIYGAAGGKAGRVEASKFRLSVKTEFPPDFQKRAITNVNILRKELEKYPRLKLLLLRRGGDINVIEAELPVLKSIGIVFTIRLTGPKEPDACNFVLSCLLMALIFGGVGSLTRRGFGSLRINSVVVKYSCDKRLQKVIEQLRSGQLIKDTLKQLLDELVNLSMEFAKKYFRIPSTDSQSSIPKVPSLNKFSLEVVECQSIKLDILGQAFLKSRWRQKFNGPSEELHTWILGLPRFVVRDGIKTGYFSSAERRISSIAVRAFQSGSKRFVIIYGFLSSDWPSELEHYGRSGRRLTKISTTNLPTVFDYVFKKVVELVKDGCSQRRT